MSEVTVTVNGQPRTAEVEPRLLLVSKALLDDNPDPTEEQIRWAISGNLCRCTGYQNIVKAVRWAAGKARDQAAGSATTSRSAS